MRGTGDAVLTGTAVLLYLHYSDFNTVTADAAVLGTAAPR